MFLYACIKDFFISDDVSDGGSWGAFFISMVLLCGLKVLIFLIFKKCNGLNNFESNLEFLRGIKFFKHGEGNWSYTLGSLVCRTLKSQIISLETP